MWIVENNYFYYGVNSKYSYLMICEIDNYYICYYYCYYYYSEFLEYVKLLTDYPELF